MKEKQLSLFSLFDQRPRPALWRRVILASFALVLFAAPLSVYTPAPVVKPSHDSPIAEEPPALGVQNFVFMPAESHPDLTPEPQNRVATGITDSYNLIDVERTYWEVSKLLGREPTMEEILFMTIVAEYWLFTQSDEGQEAVARSYYHFCKTDGCTKDELFKFLSGYQPWFAGNGRTDDDEKIIGFAEKMYNLMVNKFNYDHANGSKLERKISEILNREFATSKGWHTGKRANRPSQWLTFKPSSNFKRENALSCTKVGDGMLFCFFTFAQEHNLNL